MTGLSAVTSISERSTYSLIFFINLIENHIFSCPATFQMIGRNHHEPHTALEHDTRRCTGHILLDRPYALERCLPPRRPIVPVCKWHILRQNPYLPHKSREISPFEAKQACPLASRDRSHARSPVPY